MILLNGTPVNITVFPDNTSQVWYNYHLIKEVGVNTVEWRYEHEGEVFQILQLAYLMKEYMSREEMALYIPYLPYARQDKHISDEKTFALLPFSDVINMCEFGSVTVVDPHSHKALNLINTSKAVYPIEKLRKAFDETNSQLLCYPDKGALTKYSRLDGYKDYVYIYGTKVRDQSTGIITKYDVEATGLSGLNILIVDDICDGGATFIILAKELLNKGAKAVNLFVSHGLFSKGIKVLHEAGIKRIFTKDGEFGENNQ